ncbi:MAG TPA: hypothetical protein VFU59_01755 [Candidatus Eisenbacteria bacterium]|nr:hypothetical protein [Candidatus Eisenbacteria bacterium]
MKLGTPDRAMLGFSEGPAEEGPERKGALFVCVSVTPFASASSADALIVIALFSAPEAVAGAVITGGLEHPPMLIEVVAAAVAAGTCESAADQLMTQLPHCPGPGVPLNVMLGLIEGPLELEDVKKGALLDWESVTASASGSLADPVTEMETPVTALTVAGAVMTGFEFTCARAVSGIPAATLHTATISSNRRMGPSFGARMRSRPILDPGYSPASARTTTSL